MIKCSRSVYLTLTGNIRLGDTGCKLLGLHRTCIRLFQEKSVMHRHKQRAFTQVAQHQAPPLITTPRKIPTTNTNLRKAPKGCTDLLTGSTARPRPNTTKARLMYHSERPACILIHPWTHSKGLKQRILRSKQARHIPHKHLHNNLKCPTTHSTPRRQCLPHPRLPLHFTRRPGNDRSTQ